jgi:ATPases involved in chromosome partitioning
MGKIIAVSNQKGGVGKTTTAVNISAQLGAREYKTLLIDIDPQGNATSGFGINKREIKLSTYDLLIGNAMGENIMLHTAYKNVDILPANISLAGAEIELVDLEERELKLKKGIANIKDQYDFIIIDCPPSLGIITLNAFCACDSILVPIQCEYYALEGLSQLMATIRQVKRMYNEHIEIEGVLLTMFDGRLNLTQQVVEEVKRFFPRKVYSTPIPRNVKLSEAPSYGQPILYFDRSSKGAESYALLTQEIIIQNKKLG